MANIFGICSLPTGLNRTRWKPLLPLPSLRLRAAPTYWVK